MTSIFLYLSEFRNLAVLCFSANFQLPWVCEYIRHVFKYRWKFLGLYDLSPFGPEGICCLIRLRSCCLLRVMVCCCVLWHVACCCVLRGVVCCVMMNLVSASLPYWKMVPLHLSCWRSCCSSVLLIHSLQVRMPQNNMWIAHLQCQIIIIITVYDFPKFLRSACVTPIHNVLQNLGRKYASTCNTI